MAAGPGRRGLPGPLRRPAPADLKAPPWSAPAIGARTSVFEHFPNEDLSDEIYPHGVDRDPGVAALPGLHELRRHGRLDAERGGQPADLTKAVEAGINFFDTADIYSRGQSEEILGRGAEGAGRAPRRGGDRHQGVQPDGARAQPRRPLAQAHPASRSTPA